MAKLGKLLRSARVDQGLTQGNVAQKLGVAQATISLWERGRSRPSADQVEALERLLGPFGIRGGEDEAGGGVAVTDGHRGFARWLERAREEAGLSVAELAAKSGVSVPAIYNIESGRSPNPRAKTRRKIERALRLDAPEEVVEVAEQSGEIEGLGPLTDFDPHDKNDRPRLPGIYVFYDISDRPVYVGQGSDISRRVREHEEKFWFKRPIVTNAAFVEVKDKALRRKIEQVLIKFLKSNAVINKQYVER